MSTGVERRQKGGYERGGYCGDYLLYQVLRSNVLLKPIQDTCCSGTFDSIEDSFVSYLEGVLGPHYQTIARVPKLLRLICGNVGRPRRWPSGLSRVLGVAYVFSFDSGVFHMILSPTSVPPLFPVKCLRNYHQRSKELTCRSIDSLWSPRGWTVLYDTWRLIQVKMSSASWMVLRGRWCVGSHITEPT